MIQFCILFLFAFSQIFAISSYPYGKMIVDDSQKSSLTLPKFGQFCSSQRNDFYLKILKDPLFKKHYHLDPFFLNHLESSSLQLVLALAKTIVHDHPEMIPTFQELLKTTELDSPQKFFVPILGNCSYTQIRNLFLWSKLSDLIDDMDTLPPLIHEWGGQSGTFFEIFSSLSEYDEYHFVEDEAPLEFAKIRLGNHAKLFYESLHTYEKQKDFETFLCIEPNEDLLTKSLPLAKLCNYGLIAVKKEFCMDFLEAFALKLKQDIDHVNIITNAPMTLIVWN